MTWLDSSAVSLLETPSSVTTLVLPRYVLRWAEEDHLDVQSRLGCTRLVMAAQPPSAENGTLQSDVDIPDERDRRYWPPPSMRSDDDDESWQHTVRVLARAGKNLGF